ncbi:MAG: hypothetical protein AVDCRST_MAG53-860, partial [uncultured Solirubrobacteraceae bacterium]
APVTDPRRRHPRAADRPGRRRGGAAAERRPGDGAGRARAPGVHRRNARGRDHRAGRGRQQRRLVSLHRGHRRPLHRDLRRRGRARRGHRRLPPGALTARVPRRRELGCQGCGRTRLPSPGGPDRAAPHLTTGRLGGRPLRTAALRRGAGGQATGHPAGARRRDFHARPGAAPGGGLLVHDARGGHLPRQRRAGHAAADRPAGHRPGRRGRRGAGADLPGERRALRARDHRFRRTPRVGRWLRHVPAVHARAPRRRPLRLPGLRAPGRPRPAALPPAGRARGTQRHRSGDVPGQPGDDARRARGHGSQPRGPLPLRTQAPLPAQALARRAGGADRDVAQRPRRARRAGLGDRPRDQARSLLRGRPGRGGHARPLPPAALLADDHPLEHLDLRCGAGPRAPRRDAHRRRATAPRGRRPGARDLRALRSRGGLAVPALRRRARRQRPRTPGFPAAGRRALPGQGGLPRDEGRRGQPDGFCQRAGDRGQRRV